MTLEKHNSILISNEIDSQYPSFKLHMPLMFSIDLQNLILLFSISLLENLRTAGMRYQHDCISNITFLIWMFGILQLVTRHSNTITTASQTSVNMSDHVSFDIHLRILIVTKYQMFFM
jgi:hypothetical protein